VQRSACHCLGVKVIPGHLMILQEIFAICFMNSAISILVRTVLIVLVEYLEALKEYVPLTLSILLVLTKPPQF